MSRDEHNKLSKIENLVWEAAKIIKPNSYIEPAKVEKAKEALLRILKE